MEFIKSIARKHHVGRIAGTGSLTIADGALRLRIPEPNAILKDIGLVKDGIGVVIEKGIKGRKTKYVSNKIKYDKDDIPVELQASKYKFSIPAEKLNDTEFVFKFDKAVMLNKK